MDINKYMLDQRLKFFPEMASMSEYEEYEYLLEMAEKNPKEMTFREWFWLHPSAYRLLYYGINVVAILTFGGTASALAIYGHMITAAIIGFLTLAAVYDMVRKLRNPVADKTTFYKMWMMR